MSKQSILVFYFLTVGIPTLWAQPIEVNQTLAGARFMREDVELSSKQVQQLLRVDETLALQFKKARILSTYSGVSGFAGGLLVLLPVSTLILGGDNPEWALAAVGAGLVGVSLRLSKSSGKQTQQAIDQYNLSYGTKTGRQTTLSLTGQGIGLCIKF
ncbi:MAG: hypothetical protein O9302_01205 [Cyclobacteriaceae bacterium]|jgi:hypothetical protein|nr:hypothetical protein [Cytophagales bacterium]MCZ8326648.1 hypothetical protein [Cyclobacteriaceae bacterium]